MVKDRGTVEPIVPDDGHDVRLRRENIDPGGGPLEHTHAEDRVMHHLKEALGRMPDLDPPDLLLESVMHSVRTGRLPLRTRIMRWAGSPRSITFTPLRVAPVAAVLVAVCLALAFHVFRNETASLAVRGDRVQVVLALRSPEARSVAVMGSFNGWRAEPCEPRTVDGETRWTVTLQLPSGRYEYAFVVDGKKIIPDPGAGLHEEDGFGNHNAVLLVGNGNGNSI